MDRDEVINRIKKIAKHAVHTAGEPPPVLSLDDGIALKNAIAMLEEPELIRCKDCNHSCDYTDIYPDRAYKCIKNGGYHNDSWFCADGERRQSDSDYPEND